jgi:hypothetical protein
MGTSIRARIKYRYINYIGYGEEEEHEMILREHRTSDMWSLIDKHGDQEEVLCRMTDHQVEALCKLMERYSKGQEDKE